MTQPVQVRDACDRCHSIKTRCVRIEHDGPVCQRCDRLGLPCCYSPPGQTGRPPGVRKRKNPNTGSEEPTRPPSQPPAKKPARCSDQGNINVSTNGGALPSPGSSTISPDMFHLMSSEELGRYDASFGTEELSISPWPYFTPTDTMPPVAIETQNATHPDPMSPPPPSSHTAYYPDSGTGQHSSSSISTLTSISTSPEDATTHGQLMQLASLQSKLLVLGNSVAEAYDSFSSIEEVLIVSESLIALFQIIGPACYDLANGGNRTACLSLTQHKAAKTSQTAIFLLSNCYLSLTDIFETLITRLEKEQSSQERTGKRGGCTTQKSLVSVGATRLSMPRQAAAEVYLHLVFRMFDRLANGLRVYGGGTDADGDITQSLVSLAGRAVRSLARLEESMADRRAKAKFVIES